MESSFGPFNYYYYYDDDDDAKSSLNNFVQGFELLEPPLCPLNCSIAKTTFVMETIALHFSRKRTYLHTSLH